MTVVHNKNFKKKYNLISKCTVFMFVLLAL